MLRNLADGGERRRELEADVLVIGAGVAGLIAATRLAKAGRRVVVLESGDRHQPADTHPLNEVVQLGDRYAGAEEGRFRCLGGTSTRWGGAMLPFLPADMEPHSAGWAADWPVRLDEVTGYLSEIEALFGLPHDSYDRPELFAMADGSEPEWTARLAKWPPFKLRNVATLLTAGIAAPDGPEVWLNATATGFHLDPAGRLAGVTARGPDGAELHVRAPETIVAAGAIESTRLLLLLDRQHGDRIFAPDDVLGRYFHDHLSAFAADVETASRSALNRLAGFRFEHGGMRNLRFELNRRGRILHRLPAAFAHIGFASDVPTGFDALRGIYRNVQRRALPAVADVTALAANAPWMARAAWWRFVHRRLLVPSQARFELNLVIEQKPDSANRITLAPDRADPFGCPLAAIDWHVGEEDLDNFAAIFDRFAAQWAASTLAPLATIAGRPAADVRARIVEGGGIFHPGGTARMGAGAQAGVLDAQLRCWRIPNLSVVSTAAFPTGGAANPTLMLMLFALRTADRLAGRTMPPPS